MNNVMLDLETMGQGSNAAIVAIGAVFFDPITGEIGDSFYKKIALEDAVKFGDIDASTVIWWLKQSDAARAEITSDDTNVLREALYAFSDWIGQIENIHDRVVWGNGASFDNVILSNAYKAIKSTKPWRFWNDRDVRTVVELGLTLKKFNPKKEVPFIGTTHNAIDDAIHQAKYVSAIYAILAKS
ncbi:3'-5' exonuclease [Pseudoalteromonas sp. S16_S37]|uniref:3'-5' exonuclease n=1 Tax=Pseudoalteromonas sp. S16_S37 TaxID=2720228 RepID=UPI001681C12F|nr:3'-5' exonuclease [Pseudoalteromonas sp. S16_S37]MBD1582782.1 3'-5' exoribonuclease [Pseudoalteromonas sp. S16_S37]